MGVDAYPGAYAHDPALVSALEALVDPTTRGDPMSPLRWTCKRLSGNLLHRRREITQHSCGNETKGDRKESVCLA